MVKRVTPTGDHHPQPAARLDAPARASHHAEGQSSGTENEGRDLGDGGGVTKKRKQVYRVIDTMWNMGGTWVASVKSVDKTVLVYLVGADRGYLVSGKEAEREAPGAEALHKNCSGSAS